MTTLVEQYNGQVPDDFDKLLKLPGVGRKSANLIMGDVFGKPAIVTDTHCIRLTNRMGLVDGIKDPKKVEMALWKIIPGEKEATSATALLIMAGKYVPQEKPIVRSVVCRRYVRSLCDKNLLEFFGFSNTKEKLCVSWALSLIECVAVWALKIPVPHTDALKTHESQSFSFVLLEFQID